jgi:SAM-dependent methyltransferase
MKPTEIPKYHSLYKHYESCFKKHGGTPQGVDWPNVDDLNRRFQVMLDICTDKAPVNILDFGCGNGLLCSYLKQTQMDNIRYTGLDISQKFIDFCRTTYPGIPFICSDIAQESIEIDFDYAICNGTFTEKLDLTFDEMFDFFSKTLITLFKKSKKGIAFNVMSSHVDYRRDDLFHVPHDMMANLLINDLSRHYVIRNDYGLYEYTVYVYKEVEQV